MTRARLRDEAPKRLRRTSPIERFARVQFNNTDNSQVRIQSAPPRPARCARMRVPGQIMTHLVCGQTVERRAAGVGVMRSRMLRALTLCFPVVVVMAPAAHVQIDTKLTRKSRYFSHA